MIVIDQKALRLVDTHYSIDKLLRPKIPARTLLSPQAAVGTLPFRLDDGYDIAVLFSISLLYIPPTNNLQLNTVYFNLWSRDYPAAVNLCQDLMSLFPISGVVYGYLQGPPEVRANPSVVFNAGAVPSDYARDQALTKTSFSVTLKTHY